MLDSQIIQRDAEAICGKLLAEQLEGKTLMVTGASGIVGTYFLECLHHLKKVAGMNLKVWAVMKNEPPAHLMECLSLPGIHALRGDLSDPSFYPKLPASDLILHAAGYGQPGAFLQNPRATIQLNTTATFALLDKLRQGGKFLFVSTSEVYSGLENSPHKEMDIGRTNTDHPRACYIEGKRCGEAICNAYRAQGVDAKSARLCLAYGPGTRPGDQRALNSFIERALKERHIRLLDSGQARRTYCYVADAVYIMWRILLDGKDAIYNVGGKSSTTIAELARYIGSVLNVRVMIPKTSKTLKGAPEDARLDITKVEQQFGPLSFVSLEEGLNKTINWQRQLYRCVANVKQ